MEMTRENRDAIISALYSKCANGEISRNQRESLIQKTNSLFFAHETAKADKEEKETKVDKKDTKDTTELSPKEKYEAIKKAVYKKCKDGELDEDMKEALLEKAREKFCPDVDSDKDEDAE